MISYMILGIKGEHLPEVTMKSRAQTPLSPPQSTFNQQNTPSKVAREQPHATSAQARTSTNDPKSSRAGEARRPLHYHDQGEGLIPPIGRTQHTDPPNNSHEQLGDPRPSHPQATISPSSLRPTSTLDHHSARKPTSRPKKRCHRNQRHPSRHAPTINVAGQIQTPSCSRATHQRTDPGTETHPGELEDNP